MTDLSAVTPTAYWEESVEQVRRGQDAPQPSAQLCSWCAINSRLRARSMSTCTQTGINSAVAVRGAQAYWMGIGTDCTLACGGRGDCTLTDARTSTCGYWPFGGERATQHVARHSSRLGAVTQLTVRGRGKTPHPMHLHTMHVQLQQDVARGAFGLKGDWRDTVAAVGERGVEGRWGDAGGR